MKHLDWHQFLFRFLSIFSILLSSSFVIGYRTTRALEAATSNPPGLVVAQGLNDTTVQLTWMAVVGAESYKIYRGGSLLTSQPGTLYNNSSLSPATTYSYQVSAVSAGVESPRSAAVSATTQAAKDASPPTQPGAITVSNITPVRLS